MIRKTHCKRGHELTEVSTIPHFTKDGAPNGRACRICVNEAQRRNYAVNSKLYKDNARSYRLRHPEKVKKWKTNYNKNHPEEVKIWRQISKLRTRYGIMSIDERNDILQKQNGSCAICKRTNCAWKTGLKNAWHVDHKHNGTPNHRGILCSDCNHTIGRAKDNPALLRKMADYIESYQ
jgi:hypothetical protein